MKKFSLLLALILVTGAAAMPYFVGTEAEQIYKREVARLNQQAAQSGLENVQHEYQRGLYSSHSRLQFEVRSEQSELDRIVVVIESDISHGPLLSTDSGLATGLYASRDSLFLEDVPQELADFLQETLGDQIATASTLVTFDQQLRSLAQIAAFSYRNQGVQFDFGGAELNLASNLQTDTSSGTLTLLPLSIKDDEGSVELSQGVGEFNVEMVNPSLAVGDFSILFDTLQINTPQLNATLNALSMRTSQRLIDEKLSIEESISIGSIQAPVPLTAASYDLELSQLDPAAVDMWTQLANQFDQQLSENPELIEQEVRTLTSRIFQPGLTLNQGLRLDAFGGTVATNLDIRYIGLAGSQHPMDVQDPLLLLDALEADLLMSADEQAVNASPLAGMVDLYLDQGLLTREGDQLQLKGQLRGGQMTLNGQPFPLREMLQQQLQGNAY
ncbi:DUF945 family protein [Aestuariirhabdus sp. LZHN29]|uniref:DUF945 family protein n=1 Tax=Aestuariirhabdus sp. LZHN29 TaxID=3417462 RepID=UPI003CEC905A